MITVTRMNLVNMGNCKAFFNIIVNGVEIKGIKLVERFNTKELFVSFPREKGKDKQYYDIVKIQDINLKQELTNLLIQTYNS